MRRREFITLFGGATVAQAWPLNADAQPTASVPVVTLINARKADVAAPLAAEFRKGLGQTGLTQDKDVVVEYHWLDGHYEDIAAILDDAIGRHVAVIATPANTPGSVAAKAATSVIPVVFGVSEDPVSLGLVASLARPGGNVTGVNFFASEIDAKRLGLMHELLPQAKRLAVLINPANPDTADATVKALGEASRGLGLELLYFKASTAADIDSAFAAIVDAKVDALFIAPDGYFASRSPQLAMLATRDRIPVSDFVSDGAAAGLLMSYGTSVPEVFRQAAVYTGSIIKGAKPADLPVLQSTKFELTLNMKTARSLGLDVPPTLLARADEVIE
ncbi:MAG TPA: ABC transporter substrate-binding protein [Xanthobacteraceae bacterium]|nr:ABC transporter substrate-binding protein [Xanthobacteraceae bacterium]